MLGKRFHRESGSHRGLGAEIPRPLLSCWRAGFLSLDLCLSGMTLGLHGSWSRPSFCGSLGGDRNAPELGHSLYVTFSAVPRGPGQGRRRHWCCTRTLLPAKLAARQGGPARRLQSTWSGFLSGTTLHGEETVPVLRQGNEDSGLARGPVSTGVPSHPKTCPRPASPDPVHFPCESHASLLENPEGVQGVGLEERASRRGCGLLHPSHHC